MCWNRRVLPLSFRCTFYKTVMHLNKRTGLKVLVACATIVATFTVVLVPSMRDVVFKTAIYPTMRGLPTIDLVRMKMAPYVDIPSDMTHQVSTCPATDQTGQHNRRRHKVVTKGKLLHRKRNSTTGIVAPPARVLFNDSWSEALRTLRTNTFRDDVHRVYMPTITLKDKRSLLQTIKVFDAALRSAGVLYFLVAGSLLGSYRHHGMIPWDDDIDVGVNIRDWDAIRHALGCIPGYGMYAEKTAHWKFYRESSHAETRLTSKSSASKPSSSLSSQAQQHEHGFPFVDIFFYTQDERYLWAVTNYLQLAVLFKVKDVYPLSEATFEGMTVPVPYRAKTILTDRYRDLTVCVSPKPHRQVNESRPVTRLPCSELDYLYPMFHLDSL